MPTPQADFAVAVDIGGTFTDVALSDRVSGLQWRAKVPSTPADPSEAFVAGMMLALGEAALRPEDVGRVLHGTTVATNLILEGKTARAALVTTAGFRHVLEIGRQDIPRHANLFTWTKPKRPVPPSLVFEVRERVGPGGVILRPLDEASVAEVAIGLRRLDVQAVAVCLLHSFACPEHERRVAELLRAALPDVAVTASVEVLPVVREYERSLVTILNAGVMPAVSTYIRHLEHRLSDVGIAAPLLLMQSNGGVAGAATIGRAPALTVLSGPAAGVVGAREAAAAVGIDDIITIDIGGTSADVCLMRGGQIELTQRGRIGDWPLPLPMVDIVTIGAGGGSIARLSNGALTVGPASAGAIPGPACYGTCGKAPTVTDAHLVLGQLPPSLLGGQMKLDVALAGRAIRTDIAGPLGLSVRQAAQGILAIANSNMVGAIRVVSVERGHDPREFTLVAFGGAGPLHGCVLAELLGMPRVLVPPAPGVLSAEGLLAARLKAEFSRTLPRPDEWEKAETVFASLRAAASGWFAAERVAETERKIRCVALLRYEGQGSELSIAWPGSMAAAKAAFAEAHHALNGFMLDTEVELVTLRVEAEADAPQSRQSGLSRDGAAEAIGRQIVYDALGSQAALIFDRSGFAAGEILTGPAIVVQRDATTMVARGWQAEVLTTGALLLQRCGVSPLSSAA
jgi:N-methylhydantoinase A